MRRRLRIAGLLLGRTARRASPHARRAVVGLVDWMRVAPAALAAVLVMGAALSASSSIRDLERADVRGIVSTVGPDLSDDALIRLSGRLDPAALALARRHDPALTPAVWGVTPGWENLSLTGRPVMDALTRTGVDAQRLNAAVPVVSGALRPIADFRFTPASDGDRRRALRCLTQAVYYEAALEPRRGQEAVAQVILNRVRDPNFPASVCGVVYQGAERVTGCQFSFTCDGSLSRAPVAWAWNRAEDVARRALEGFTAAWVGTATHYHADYVRPWWSPTVTKVNQVGAHIFYRWTGAAGDTPAFRQAYSGREPVIDEARFARPRLLQVATSAEELEQAGVIQEGRTVVIDGRERQVGIVSLGGRRQAQSDEIAAINARLAEYEAGLEPRRDPRPAVPQLDVEEVGRPEQPAS
ncbi:cell wall hydrolase [Brevundimonas sp.]|uniref:cell wall hydrolase n=1 Tax=Brevundimonas sp. TaxID=1871086 RepID=UPI0025DD015B|nr:cell wall hydrolase [Brevundimonas sp.]